MEPVINQGTALNIVEYEVTTVEEKVLRYTNQNIALEVLLKEALIWAEWKMTFEGASKEALRWAYTQGTRETLDVVNAGLPTSTLKESFEEWYAEVVKGE